MERPGALQPEQISAESLQSPHDPDATYRRKGGEEYPGRYVVGVSETRDPEAEVQLITDVQVAPNTTDDQVLLKRSLEGQFERDVALEEMTTDGGFTGPEAEEVCSGQSLFGGWIFSRDTVGDVHERGPNEPCSGGRARARSCPW